MINTWQFETYQSTRIEYRRVYPAHRAIWKKGTVILPLSSVTSQMENHQITFALTADSLPFYFKMDKVRVVGIGLSLLHDEEDILPVEYTTGFPSSLTGQPSAAKAIYEQRAPRLNATFDIPPQALTVGGTMYQRPA